MDDVIHKKKLSNGLEILVIERPKTNLILAELSVNAGKSNIYETSNEIEIAHLLEHFNAKLTSKKYPSYKEVKSKLDFLGIKSNAMTSIDSTVYFLYGKVKDHIFILDLLLNSYHNFNVDQKLFEQEREAVINELESRKYDINYSYFTYLTSQIFKFSHSMDSRIESIKGMTLERILKFREKFYCPNNTKMILIGDISHKKIFKLIDDFFKDKVIYKCKIPKVTYSFPTSHGNIKFHERKDLTSTQIFISFANLFDYSKIKNKKIYITSILSQRLFRILRMEGGMVYYSRVYEFNSDYYNSIIIETQVRDKNNIIPVIKLILEQVNRLKNKDISESRYLKVKNHIEVNTLLDNLDNDFQSISDYYRDYLLKGKQIIKYKDFINSLLNVKLNELNDISNELFNYKTINIVYYGKHNIDNEIDKVIKNSKIDK